MYFPPDYDRYAPSAFAGYAILSTKHGSNIAVVRFLVICWAPHNPMADMPVPTGRELFGPYQENQDDLG